ncbi:MAG: MFS transporter [Verrucomicrobia bacterium]|nr:MFS transporter [Verrucomicrobiota bacterium]
MTLPVQPCANSAASPSGLTVESQQRARVRTLWLCGVLHAFTHLYNVALLPLYLLIQADLQLASVDQATMLVTVMMIAYFGPSYPMGLLADRFSRKRILGIGLALNGLGFVGLAFCSSYAMALACVVLAGLGGSFYHPAATAMVARSFPTNTGKALGLVAVGASVGFFIGPIYTGWRAAVSGNWRTPILELGLLGIAAAVIFLRYAQEDGAARANREAGSFSIFRFGRLRRIREQPADLASLSPHPSPLPKERESGRSVWSNLTQLFAKRWHRFTLSPRERAGVRGNAMTNKEEGAWENNQAAVAAPAEKMFPNTTLWLFFIGASLAFSLRDFTGWSMGSLGSLFMQKAHGFDLNVTGLALSSIFLASIVSNPLFGGLSDRGRSRWLAFVLIVSAILVAVFPRVPKAAVIPALALYGFFFLAGYPIIEAALMESVHDSVRGRVFGAFITIGGTVGNLAHWAVGAWVKRFGAEASDPVAYYPLYTLLALLVVFSLAGLPCLRAIRKREIHPPSE